MRWVSSRPLDRSQPPPTSPTHLRTCSFGRRGLSVTTAAATIERVKRKSRRNAASESNESRAQRRDEKSTAPITFDRHRRTEGRWWRAPSTLPERVWLTAASATPHRAQQIGQEPHAWVMGVAPSDAPGDMENRNVRGAERHRTPHKRLDGQMCVLRLRTTGVACWRGRARELWCAGLVNFIRIYSRGARGL